IKTNISSQEAPHALPFRFDFLPTVPTGVIQFPRRLLRYDDFYAANFDALAKSLYLQLLSDCGLSEEVPDENQEKRIRGWFTDMLDAEMDASEIDLLIEHCKAREDREDLLVRLVIEHKDTLVQSRTVHCKLAGVISTSSSLKRKLKGKFLEEFNLQAK
uniref:MRP-S28 domain-containing protein n=1 Tax=Macrostomum lignano TaxID=282301 RepID=A0A1I8H3Q5_9PLAT